MKKKIKFLGLTSAFVFVAVFAVSIKGFANTEGVVTYTTQYCEYFSPDGSLGFGTMCILPDPIGPCDVRINCHI